MNKSYCMKLPVFDLADASVENPSLSVLLDPLGISSDNRLPRTGALTTAKDTSDEIVDGIDLKALSSEIAAGCAAMMDPGTFDPILFIRAQIEKTARRHVTSQKLLAQITHDATIGIKYVANESVRPSDWRNGEAPAKQWVTKPFTLAEICTDHHLRVLKDVGYKQILWPSSYPRDLVQAFTDADYQRGFKDHLTDGLKPKSAKLFGKLLKRAELHDLVIRFIKDESRDMEDRQLAFDYLRGLVPARTMILHSRPELKVDNAVFIGANNLSRGILFFLGEDKAAIEYPEGPDERGRFVENNPDLQKRLLKRVPLSEQQKPHVRDFKYRGLEFPLFATRPVRRQIAFFASNDIADTLLTLQIDRALADIDTLVSTAEERLTDTALEATGYLLQCLAFAASLPWGGSGVLASASLKILASMLLGLGASATDLIRAEISDDPAETDRLRIAAAIGALAELAGPIGERLLGKALSVATKKRLGQRVVQAMNLINHPSSLRRPSGSISHQLASTVGKEIPESAKGALVAGRLHELAGGPGVAQTIASDTQLVRYAGPEKGFVYQGFTFRGDTRDTSVVFKEGFRQRTVITDLNQVNGFKGGYGGAHDALAPDGAGISTSAFYKKDGAGAYVYGGAKGGFTYFIDARQLEGFHLYANTELMFRPESGLRQLPPLEINYAVDISPRLILGAYDSAGRFIPNPSALRLAIEASGEPGKGLGREIGKQVGEGAEALLPEHEKEAPINRD